MFGRRINMETLTLTFYESNRRPKDGKRSTVHTFREDNLEMNFIKAQAYARTLLLDWKCRFVRVEEEGSMVFTVWNNAKL